MANRIVRDAFTDSVMRRLDPAIRESLSPDQLAAIEDALSASRPLARHPVDLRGTIPLFLARYYFVLLMGRDRRTAARRIERERRRGATLAAGAAFAVIAVSPLLLGLIVAAYVLKSALGIDLLPAQHGWEVLGFLK